MTLRSGSSIRIGPRRSTLGALIKSGGAGSVYLLPDDAHSVAKIYHERVDPPSYTDRIEAMLELRPHLPDQVEGGKRYVQIAWPHAVVRDERGRFVGFTMPALDVKSTSELEQVLQERQARAAGLPVGLGAKVTLAANLSAVLAALHAQHHYVVDLKPVNLRFYRASLYIALLDCDGFSIQGQGKRFSAPQVTPDYLAPEFQVRKLGPDGEETQDRFALAVVVFQLLNFGIHPYSGRPASDRVPTDIPARIRERHYAYGLRAHRMMTPSPVSAHAAIPLELRELFDRAFGKDGEQRPSAAEWSRALRSYAQPSSGRLVVCARNREHQHYASQPCASCVRAELIAKTARNATPRPKPNPRPEPSGGRRGARGPVSAVTAAQMAQMQAQLTRMQAQMQAQTAQNVAQAQRSWWPRGSGAAVASKPWSSRIGIAVRVSLAVALPWSFARIAQFVQALYAQLLPSSGAAALDGWMNAILMTLLGAGFLAACGVFMLVLPRMLKNR
ncbi:hypothetical protein [Lysobacter sp. ESA13C]|uniref:hypothetical protein n=1 Tax=Lysobacter sp. ESA13C TaxID=2862676 RepID=UPI001CC135CF|nr:hypothetical protein [Lysobacter sp. ESA13C]